MSATATKSLESYQRIVILVHEATEHGVNIMGEGGRILASSDPVRVGTIHDGGRQVMAGHVEVKPLQRMAALALQQELDRERLAKREGDLLEDVRRDIGDKLVAMERRQGGIA